MWASKMLHHSYDIFVHNLKKLFDYFLTSFHCTTGKLNSPGRFMTMPAKARRTFCKKHCAITCACGINRYLHRAGLSGFCTGAMCW
jgi:hypothetical protein